MASVVGLVFFLFLWHSCESAYFEDQPKFLTENGNFVIESAVDRNITFRLKGRSSYLNINDMNVMNMMKMGGFNGTNIPSSNLALRLSAVEQRLRQIPTGGDSRPRNRNIMQRLSSLELRLNNSASGINVTEFERRMRLVETKVNWILEKVESDNCTSNPCANGGTCTETFRGYSCKCPEAWTGVNCDEDVNECANFAGTTLGCQNSVACENTLGGYNCRCMNGWYGTHCTLRTVDCLATTSYNLCDHGVCVHTNDANGYRCICDQGWISNGTTPACSTDVDECNSPTPHCSVDPEVPCINLPGTYACGQCPHGFTGNGHYCKDIDECQDNNGGCSIAPFVMCINTRGSSKCGQCPFGYSGDGRICIRTSNVNPILPPIATDTPPFQQNQCTNPSICHPSATCVQNLYGVTCVCPPHYTGNGIGPFGCTHSNNTFDGCSINPCLNGGTCVSVGSFGYRCECPPGTSAPRCSRSFSLCDSNPCQNGGTCTQISRMFYRCTCPAGKTGRNCQQETRSCGGILTSFNGTLKYPVSDTYPHNARCAWLIRTEENKVLNITFTKFNVESSRECRFDWLQIHDGRSSAAFHIGRFCGSDLPKGGNIISTQNTLYLWFRSDNSSAHDGFELTWNSIDPVCGGEISIQSHGIIASPGSPGNYPPNRDCVWKLTAPTNNRIQLHFFTLQLEAHEQCNYDYLAIYDGLSAEGEPLEKFCNTTHPPPLTSPANQLTLQFHSDDDGTDAGFQIHYSLVEGFQGCGGTFTAKSGEFGSPIQNGQYPKNIECHYLIKMPRKNETRVKLSFLSFKLEGSSSCSFDYVEIYEGNNVNAPKVGRWCGSRMPPEYSSLSNEILIVFHTDFSFSDDGFRLKYETVCGGKFEDDNGIITSPWYPNAYDDNKICIYDIEAPLGKAIVLNFTNFDIEADCDFDSLRIYDGVDSNATLIGTYCGNENPPVATSHMNHLHLIFSTDSSNNGPGFKATYKFIDAGCGGSITRPNVTITSSTSGESGYQNLANCRWFIVAPPGSVVQLRFTSFDLESYPECRYDYVEIFDNIVTNDSNARSIGKYCGTEAPPIILSTSRALTIHFKTDDSVTGDGFMATYEFIDGRNLCGGNFYSLTGTIISPNYPDRYPGSKDCVYIINAPNGKQIELNIESFDLEESNGCSFDSLEIRNGASEKSPLIGTFCGTDILPRFKSFSNHMYLRFRSDSSNENRGFKINYDTATSGCGGIFTNAQSGTISSPNYPEPYPANMQCDYTIQVARGSTINLLVTDLTMETSSDCTFDYIAIHDGPNAAAKLLGTYCHSDQIINLESSSNSIFLRMVTDVSNQERGFEAKFSANCKREIRDLRGAIESPNFPANYPHYANCEWKLIPPMGNRVFLEFSHFELEHSWTDTESNNCLFDHLTIEERDSSDAVLSTDRYCHKMPKPLNTSHIVVLKFETDYSNALGGFHLEYEMQGCGGMLIKPEGHFNSPNYPNNYPRDTQCQWVIQVEYGHLIEITFTDFDFEASMDCKQDGLIISNNANATKVINKFCGSIHNNQKQVVTSSENIVYVHFYTDLSYSGRGFSATYKSVPARCGGIFAVPQGNITSLNYPNNYPENINCQWLLRTEASHTISFQYTDFDLEDQNCMADHVSIYDGSEMKEEKLLLRSCGSQTFGPDSGNQTARPGFTKPIKSSGNEMLIVMETDDSITAKGFAAQFETSCGSKINTSTSGILEIGHNLRWLADGCEWTISANDPSQHVSLSIMHMDNEPVFQKYIARLSNQTSSPCLRKIYVHDGTSTSAPKIAEICSNKHPPTITSEGSALTLSLADVSEQDFAFTFDLKAAYSVFDNACGGEFGSISGQIASPGYPKTYKNNIECEWTIKASPGNEMEINIDMLDIDQTEHCNGDYLEVREKDSAGKIIGVYCGTSIPPTLPRVNTYWLKFRSDNDGVGRGFRLEYNYAKMVEQTGQSGVITSMMYPSYLYFTLGSYKWRITVDPGKLIRVTIDNCILKRDSQIWIYDGYDKSSGLLQTIETDAIPTGTILSSTNVLFVEFEIPTFSESKFKLVWNEVPKSAAEELDNVTNSLNCSKNSVITVSETDSLKIQSPGFPYGYDFNTFCQWTFLPSKMGYHVGISFTTIDLESSADCLADYVRVGSGSDMQQFQQSSRMCAMSQIARSSRFHGAPNLRVQFQSDFSTNRTGFEGVVMLDCGGVFEAPQGEISNRMTVSNRSQFWMNDTCSWTVSVARGRTIQFEFKTLNLVKNDDGSCNSYIIIRNGIHDDSPFLGLGKYCGDSPTIPKTSGNKAIVQFVRNRVFRPSNEFVLKYEQVEYDCGGSFTLDYMHNSTVITTPNYPNIPSAHIECVWRITAPNGELLKVEFLERFDLTSAPSCLSEYLEVREGSTASSPVIGKYCSVKPLPIFTTSNMVRLKYFTDVSVPKNGFKAKISFARCGKSIIASSGYISSPGFPGKGAYPTQTTCDYHITGRVGTDLNITFLSLDLPEAENCSEVDHIEIYSIIRNPGGNTTNAEVTKVCGSEIPDSIMTFSTSALIRFVSKSGNSLYSGFRFMFQSTVDVCGARIEASTGIIQSPGYPSSPDTTRYCEWMITVPKGRRVKVEVLDFDVKPSPVTVVNSIVFATNTDHRVSFYNDFLFASHITTLIANNQTVQPTVIYSSDNKLAVSALIRRSNFGRRGFKMRFTSNEPTVCEGNLNDNEGTFQTPDNTTRFYCEFIRESQRPFIESQPNNGTLSIKIFEELLYTNRSQCTPNLPTGISVIFFANERRTFYTKCPPKYDNIASPYATTKLTLRSTLFHKYRFPYKVHSCGGVMTETQTKISVPTTIPSNYGELDCAWQYSTSTERNIQMILNAPAMNCDTDYVNIYRGKASNRPKVNRICGDAVSNRTITITGQSVFVEYHSDNYNSFQRFSIDIVTSDGICGGILDAPNYAFSSPKIGTKYPPNTECEWTIRAQNGYHVGLIFTNRFMIETSVNCTKDYVKVFNKVDGEFKEIKRLCGRETPQFLNSTGREMKVLFRTDGDGDGDGFTAQWAENCGGVFRATSIPQLITSPRYPDPYPKNAFCNYSIVADEGQSVSVKFLTFDLEGSNTLCNFDNVTIYKPAMYSFNNAMEQVGTYCLNNSVTTFRYPSRIDVVFRTDSFIERRGFQFEYSTDKCGGNVTTSTQIGSITDNGDGYLPLASCVWFITAPSDKKIVIRFEQFDLEHMSGCYLDYVEVYEGHRTIENNRKARLCGNLTEHAPLVAIDSNKAIVKFASDATINEKGFTALILFTKNCNQHINLTHDQPKYTLNKLTGEYEPLLTCEYFINAPSGYVVKAKFNQMHLVPCETIAVNNSCTCDYLNVRDGSGPFAESFGSFCGHSNPPDILSTTPSLYMRFVTDNIGAGTGFSVDLEMVESPCGPSTYHLNDSMSSITIQSPMMNRHAYMPNMNCIWQISSELDKLIEVHFEQFDLEPDDQNKCTNDFLEISDDETKQYVREGIGENVVFSGSAKSKNQYFYWGRQWPTAAHRYCGNNTPIDYLSSYRTIYVHFKSNEQNEASGFKFTAKIISECARNYTQPQGRLFAKQLADCEAYISVPENYTISLYFASIDFRLKDECTETNTPLKIYNGRNNELLDSYCGDSIPKPLFTTTNLLKLKFKNTTLAYTPNDVYDITYVATDKGRGCGGELYNYGGTFSSPGYPNTDRNNSDCTWTINVPMNLLVAVQFSEFDMGPRTTCELNYVELIENDDSVAPTKFCGTDDPAPYKAKSSQLKVHFKSSMNFAGTGWVINFMAVHENSVINKF